MRTQRGRGPRSLRLEVELSRVLSHEVSQPLGVRWVDGCQPTGRDPCSVPKPASAAADHLLSRSRSPTHEGPATQCRAPSGRGTQALKHTLSWPDRLPLRLENLRAAVRVPRSRRRRSDPGRRWRRTRRKVALPMPWRSHCLPDVAANRHGRCSETAIHLHGGNRTNLGNTR